MSLNQMKLWMKTATTEEQRALAVAAGTTHNYLYHLSSDPSAKYHRETHPETAAKIEAFTQELNKTNKGRTPIVYRTDIVTACRNCVFAQQCLGSRALASQFPFVEPEEETRI
jgi:hypothetical protein